MFSFPFSRLKAGPLQFGKDSSIIALLLQFKCSLDNRTDGQCSLLPILFVCKMSQNLVSTEGVPTRSLRTLYIGPCKLSKALPLPHVKTSVMLFDSDDRMRWNYPSIAKRRGEKNFSRVNCGNRSHIKVSPLHFLCRQITVLS